MLKCKPFWLMLPITLAVSQAWGAQGDNVQELEPVVVTATPQKRLFNHCLPMMVQDCYNLYLI